MVVSIHNAKIQSMESFTPTAGGPEGLDVYK